MTLSGEIVLNLNVSGKDWCINEEGHWYGEHKYIKPPNSKDATTLFSWMYADTSFF